MLLLWLPGSFLLRFDARTFRGLLFHEPPRSVSALFPFRQCRKKIRAARPFFFALSPGLRSVWKREKEKE
jgi:hypothetical protein